MFSCFSIKKGKEPSNLRQENKNKNDKDEKELQLLLKNKKNEHNDLIIESECTKLQIYFLEEILANYKLLLIDYNNEKNRKLANTVLNENLMKVMTRENFEFKHQYETLNGTINSLRVNLNELVSSYENSTNFEDNKLQKMICNEFILENLFMKKENQIFNLETYLKNLKNYKKSKSNLNGEIFFENSSNFVPGESALNLKNNNQDGYLNEKGVQNRISREEDILLKKIQVEELENARYNYQKSTKQTINLKTNMNKNLNKIEEVQREIDSIKNPNQTPLQPKNSVNLSENSKNNLNTMPSSNGNIALRLTETNDNKFEKNMIKLLNEEYNSNLTKIQELQAELENQKKLNDKIEIEISSFNNELSDKFSTIFKLEMKLDKLKSRKKKNKTPKNL